MSSDPCGPIIDEIKNVNTQIAALQAVLDQNFPPLTQPQRAEAEKLLAAQQSKLSKEENALTLCRQQHPVPIGPRPCTPFTCMKDEGSPGQWLDTTGTTIDGSKEIVVANPDGWKVGSGVAVYDSTTQKGFKGRIAVMKGELIVLDTAATFTAASAVVSSDDSVVYAAVYARLKAAGGGTIFWPAGTYRVGAKDVALPQQAFGNTPLFVSSRIRNVGEGVGSTILKLADEVNMLWPGYQARPLTVCAYWTCGPLFMNEGNRWWFNPRGVGQEPKYDAQVEISDMTIDCNKENQSRVYKPSSLDLRRCSRRAMSTRNTPTARTTQA